MPRKLGSATKDTLADLKTALDRLLAARMYLRSAGANYTLAQLARTINNLEEEIGQAERRYATELRPFRPVNRRGALLKRPKRNGKNHTNKR
jgi:hypothetical protein